MGAEYCLSSNQNSRRQRICWVKDASEGGLAGTRRSFDNYRSSLNKVEATADFMFDVSKDLLWNASGIQEEFDYGDEGLKSQQTSS